MDKNIDWKKYEIESVLNYEDDHVFKIDVEKHFITILDNYKDILSEKELVKSKKYNKEADAKRYLISKYFLRKILSKFIHVEPNAIRFEQTSNKKPTVAGVEFNLTHSGKLVLIAISKSLIGIDLEYINKEFDFNPLLSNCFHQDEIDFLKANNNKIDNFYKLWTRKEALLKATGEGLIDELDQINSLGNEVRRRDLSFDLQSFSLEDNNVISIARLGNPSKINFWSL